MGNGYKIYKTIVFITTIITLFVTIAADKGSGYDFIFCIPLVYLILFSLCNKMHYYSARYNGLLMLNGLMFLKYVIAILATCATHSYSLANYYTISVSTSSYHWATLILVGEEIAIFLTVEIFSGAIYRNVGTYSLIKEYARVKTGPVIILFLLGSFALVALYPNNLLGSISILVSSENQMTQVIERSHVLDTIFGAFKIILFGILINKCIVMYQNTEKKKYIFFSYVLIVFHCLMNVSTSRMNIIIPFIVFALITSKIFNKTGLYFNIVITIALAVIIGIVSVYKMPWIFMEGGSPLVLFFSDFTKRLQEYTSNIMPTAIGLQAIDAYNSSIDITTFFKDIFGVMPIVSHALDEKEMIYTIYNQYAIGGVSNTQLIPMTISSIAYFTPIFTYLLVVSCTLMLMIVEKKNDFVARNYINDYLKLYLFFVFASCTFSNVQMIAGRLFTNYFPAIIVLLVNRKLGNDYKFIIGGK